jgi:hypothetical protein
MSARVWTREELDRVHPLPEGWAWRLWDGEPMACSGELEIFADGDEVWGQGRGANMTALPSAVCIAVILASQGLDSREAMAAEMDSAADEDRECCAERLRYAADMLRRGTVTP